MRIPFGFTEKCGMKWAKPWPEDAPYLHFTLTAASIDAKLAARTPTAGTDS